MGVNVALVEEKLASAENQVRVLENRCAQLDSENGDLALKTVSGFLNCFFFTMSSFIV